MSEHAGGILANWVDIFSLSLAILYGIGRSIIARQRLISRTTGLSIANGIGLFPLLLLVVSTFWNDALTAMLQSNKVILSIAGIVALLSIMEDFTKRPPTGGIS